MEIAVPSKGRAGKVKTQQILSQCLVYVPEIESEAYILGGTKNVISVPNSIKGITQTRNWILKNSKNKRVVMIDDDVKSCGYFKLYERKAKQKKLTEDEWLAEFEKLFDITEGLNYRIWGVSTDGALRSVYPYNPFLWKSYITASCMGIVNDGQTFFDENFTVKEDYELNLRCIVEDGGVVCARYLYWANDHWHEDGGCKDYRSEKLERSMIRKLKTKYPGMVRATYRKNSPWCIELNV